MIFYVTRHSSAMALDSNYLPMVIVWVLLTAMIHGQNYQRPNVQPIADNSTDCICEPDVVLCKCTFKVEHRLTMLLFEERQLVVAKDGVLKKSGSDEELTDEEKARVTTADGEGSRLIIAINGKFPGPRVEVFEDQEIEITVINTFNTDSITVHFHGINQKNTPWMDGVAFVTQCPILPGQSFVYRFRAYPPGTSFYHAHIGDQRTMGLYGPFIVRKRETEPISEIIVSLQDWNHLMDAETAYLTMLTEQYDFTKTPARVIPMTSSVDGALFSRFAFQSGLVNGKGRYWMDNSTHNGAPLERFKVQIGTLYRFRVIGSMTLYPMRVYIEGQTLSLRSSDCFNLKNVAVQSIIIHPGERYDFHVQFQESNGTQKQYLLIAETIETSVDGYHAAEAIIEIENVVGKPSQNPVNSKLEQCTKAAACKVFNCPYGNTGTDIRACLNYNDIQNSDPIRDPSRVTGDRVDNEYFFNFAFPGFPGDTPGSVNGKAFVPLASPLLTQPTALTTGCDEEVCKRTGTCKCTYVVDIPGKKLIQMTFLNIGNGSGWSHPVHLHGHSFFVMKMGFGTYDPDKGKLLNESTDIRCTDKYGFCSEIEWSNSSWNLGNIPYQNVEPPLKDTIVVPTGGYVVIRFISDNPGMWYLHCHIDLHNTNGMAMVINVSPGNHAKAPVGFPRCGNFYYNGKTQPGANADCDVSAGGIVEMAVGTFLGGLLVSFIGKSA